MTKTGKTLFALLGLATLLFAQGCATAPATKPAAAEAKAAAPPAAAAAQPSEAKAVVKCPVSGGDVEVSPDALHSTYKGKDYYFCCAPCKVDFDKDPEKYIQGK